MEISESTLEISKLLKPTHLTISPDNATTRRQFRRYALAIYNKGGFMQNGFSDHSYLNVQDVCEMLQLNRSTIYRQVKQGIFPKPTKIGKSSRWKFADIKAFLEPKPQEAN